MKKTIIAIAATAAILQGCASTPNSLKNDPALTAQFTVDQNYQRVYRNLLTKFRECKGEGWAGVFAQMHIVEGLYPDLGEAEISYMMSNFGTKNYYLHIDISKTTADKTNVNAYIQLSTWKRVLSKIEPWAINLNASCN